MLTDDGLTVARALRLCLGRGVSVKGLLWRSHPSWLTGSLRENRSLAIDVNRAGGELFLDHRVRRFGSHHQKFVVIRHATDPDRDLAFVGGIDLARSRRDTAAHDGDPLSRPFAKVYGPRPAWHDVTLELRGPVVEQVEEVFRERWNDPQPMTRLPWHRIPDQHYYGLPQTTQPLAPAPATPAAAGRCTVQLLRTYPRRRPAYPFAPAGERSIARGLTKALTHARRLVYVEDQYLWSAQVTRVFVGALRRNPHLHVISVAPPTPDSDGQLKVPELYGQKRAQRILREAGVLERVHRFDLEADHGWPIYVHAKFCVVDDVWVSVGSSNLNRRSWTHDSELTAVVLDEQGDRRDPTDPAGRGDGARRFARELRLEFMREHLGRGRGEDADLLDPADALEVFSASAARLDAWHRSGRIGPRPPGRLRTHVPPTDHPWLRPLAALPYALVYDPDARPLREKLSRPR